jgi:hypothetical protein
MANENLRRLVAAAGEISSALGRLGPAAADCFGVVPSDAQRETLESMERLAALLAQAEEVAGPLLAMRAARRAGAAPARACGGPADAALRCAWECAGCNRRMWWTGAEMLDPAEIDPRELELDPVDVV